MTAAKQIVDNKYLKSLIPLGDLDAERFQKILGNYVIEKFEAGETLFQIGDRDNRTIYLLSGQIVLTFRSGTQRVITADTPQSRHALVPEQPRQATAAAKTPVTILVFETDVLEQVLHWSDNHGFEVSELEIESDNDWMTRFLQSKAFLKLRAQNIQALMMRLEEIPVKAGQVIIRQGSDDSNYYIIKRGHCKVTRKAAANTPEVELAQLGVGAGFGEEAIIMKSKRGATVTMMDNGLLMRLPQMDFRRLLAEPLIQIVPYDEAAKNNRTIFLDVRAPTDYTHNGLKKSINVPLAELRTRIHTFEPHKQYVVVSNSGGRASAATFLLCQQGLDAVVLRNGLKGVPVDVPRLNGPKIDEEDLPIVDNVVSFTKADAAAAQNKDNKNPHASQQTSVTKNEKLTAEQLMTDPRVNGLFEKAKQRVNKEAEKAHAAEQARHKAEDEVARLKGESERARLELEETRKQIEQVAQDSAQAARLDVMKQAARMREKELGNKQAEVEEAIRRSEQEAQRATAAEFAYEQAQQEIAQLKQEMQDALTRTEEEAKRSADAIRLFAEKEAQRYREKARKHAERELQRIYESEEERRKSDEEITRLKTEAEQARVQLEEQARIAADVARTAAEQEAARLRAEELASEQAAKREAIRIAEENAQRAAQAEQARRKAEEEIQRLRKDAERAREDSVEQARIVADQARSQAEQDAAEIRSQELARKQIEIEEAVRKAEEEAERARIAEDARRKAEEEIRQLREYAEVERARIAEQARLIAEAARQEAERVAQEKAAQALAEKQAEILQARQHAQEEEDRARAAEMARIKAEEEIQRLKDQAENARRQIEEKLSEEIARSEVEHEVARMRAQELVSKQREIDLLSRRADSEADRARQAEQARQRAEAEMQKLKSEVETERLKQSSALFAQQPDENIIRKQAEIEILNQRVGQESARAHAAEIAFGNAQQEIEQLRTEVAVATMQAKAQLAADVERAEMEDIELRGFAMELEEKQKQIELLISHAQSEAQRAQDAVEARMKAEDEVEKFKAADQARRKAEDDVERLKAKAGKAVFEAQEQLKKAEERARKKAEKEIARIRREEAARQKAELENVARKAGEEAKRAAAAEKARRQAEAEIKRLKTIAATERKKAEKAIQESIKSGGKLADNSPVKKRAIVKAKQALSRNQRQAAHAIQQFVQKKDEAEWYQHEPDTHADDWSLLFTDVPDGQEQTPLVPQQIVPQSAPRAVHSVQHEKRLRNVTNNRKDNPQDNERSEPQLQNEGTAKTGRNSAFVSDQVMWETALGIREDENVEGLMAPDFGAKKSKPAQAQFQAPVSETAHVDLPQYDDQRNRASFKVREINPLNVRQTVLPENYKRKSAYSRGSWTARIVLGIIAAASIYSAVAYHQMDPEDQIALQLKIFHLFGKNETLDTYSNLSEQNKLKQTLQPQPVTPAVKTTTPTTSTSSTRVEPKPLPAAQQPAIQQPATAQSVNPGAPRKESKTTAQPAGTATENMRQTEFGDGVINNPKPPPAPIVEQTPRAAEAREVPAETPVQRSQRVEQQPVATIQPPLPQAPGSQPSVNVPLPGETVTTVVDVPPSPVSNSSESAE